MRTEKKTAPCPKECQATRSDIQISVFLSEEGKGLDAIRRIDQEREKKEQERGD